MTVVTLVALLVASACDGLLPASKSRDGLGGAGGGGIKPGSGAVTRQTHETFLPIQTGAHGNADCNSCHGGFPTFTMFSCVGCHEHSQAVIEPAHVGVTGYQFDSKTCLTCHPQGLAGTVSRAGHRYFPIDVGTKHATSQCADCHTTADKKQFTCIGCHDHAQAVTDPKHVNIMNYRFESASCFRCHADGQAKFEHATLGAIPNCIGCHRDDLAQAVTTPASTHTANAFPDTCESCHKSFAAWGPGTLMQHQPVGGPTSKCGSCHLTTFAAALSPFNHAVQKVSADTCNNCHTDFTTWMKFVHNPADCYNGATRRSHENATCIQCHATPGDFSKSSCTACHKDRGLSCND